MSFSSDLWNGFDILKKNFLTTYNKIKHFYEIIFSFASLEKNHSKNLEILYEQNKDLFNSDEFLPFPYKTFISSLKIETEYHKYYYNNIFDNILSPLKEIIDNKKLKITKIFCDSSINKEKFKRIIQNIISKQENYYISCKELGVCLSEIEIYNLNNETKKKQTVNKALVNKKEKAHEKVKHNQEEYLSTVTESNVILKDYNIKMENLLNDLGKNFLEINTCVKDCLLKYSKNKSQLHKDILEMTNNGINTCYEKIDLENNIKNFVKKNATKEFKYHKFEYNPFKLNNINQKLLFNDEQKKQDTNQERVIQKVKKFFVDNKISGSDSQYIESTINSLKKLSLQLNIKYDSILEKNKNEENKNLISEFPENENNQNEKNNKTNNKTNTTNTGNNINLNKEKEITNNIKLIENFINKLTIGEQNIDNDITKIKSILQKNREDIIYLDNIIKGLDNYRSHGNYILSEKSYDYFLNLFTFILDNYNTNDNMLKHILIYSQTFYKIKQGTKIPKHFILYNIMSHNIFNQCETWHRIINYSLTNFSVNKDLSINMSKEEREKKLEENVFKILIENLSIMKLFKLSDKIFNEVKNYYIEVYKIDNEMINKEINCFCKENNFSVNNENENKLIKGENINALEENVINEDKGKGDDNKIDKNNDENKNDKNS